MNLINREQGKVLKFAPDVSRIRIFTFPIPHAKQAYLADATLYVFFK
jgi:hypothetical protein